MKSKREQPYKYLTMISQVGIAVFVPIGLMIFFGKVLDYFFHTGNIVVLICAALGMMAGLRNLYVVPLRMSELAQKKAAAEKVEEAAESGVEEIEVKKKKDDDYDENDKEF